MSIAGEQPLVVGGGGGIPSMHVVGAVRMMGLQAPRDATHQIRDVGPFNDTAGG